MPDHTEYREELLPGAAGDPEELPPADDPEIQPPADNAEKTPEERLLAFARTLAGDDADAAVLDAMCAAAAGELAGRLRDGISPEALGETFVRAAGVLALGMYCAVKDGNRLKSFRAGNLSAEYADGEASPESLRMLAEQMLSAYLADRSFGFMGVRG